MKVYTKQDLDTFERDDLGRLICPSGDYTQIHSFGERCSFGKRCSFENIQGYIDRFVKIDRIGSRKGCTYFFKTLSNIYVRCGCFFGTIDEFEQKVKETHEHNEQYLKEYLEAIKYVKAIL